ncbi:MAG: TRAP transporter substrate-binding protein DctP [Halorhodospira sp.]
MLVRSTATADQRASQLPLRRLVVIAALVGGVLGSGCDGPERPEQWRIALEETAGGVQHEYASRFAEEVEARTDGAVEVRLYPYGALGSVDDVHEQLRNNAVHFAFGSGDLAEEVPESQAFGLHFALSDDPYVNARALNDPELLRSEPVQAAYREARLELLALVPEGWQVWGSDQSLRRPEDFKGVRLRVMDSPVLRETYRAYGARPVHVAFGELYQALSEGEVAATEHPLFLYEDMAFHDHHTHLTLARHAPHVASFMASRVFFERLPAERQQMLRTISEDLVEWAHRMQRELNEQRRGALADRDGLRLIELEETQRAAFQELARPLRAVYTSNAGPRAEQVLVRLLEVVERAEEEHGGNGA